MRLPYLTVRRSRAGGHALIRAEGAPLQEAVALVFSPDALAVAASLAARSNYVETHGDDLLSLLGCLDVDGVAEGRRLRARRLRVDLLIVLGGEPESGAAGVEL